MSSNCFDLLFTEIDFNFDGLSISSENNRTNCTVTKRCQSITTFGLQFDMPSFCFVFFFFCIFILSSFDSFSAVLGFGRFDYVNSLRNKHLFLFFDIFSEWQSVIRKCFDKNRTKVVKTTWKTFEYMSASLLWNWLTFISQQSNCDT